MIASSIMVVLVCAMSLAFYRAVVSDKNFRGTLIEFLWEVCVFAVIGLMLVFAIDKLIQYIA